MKAGSAKLHTILMLLPLISVVAISCCLTEGGRIILDPNKIEEQVCPLLLACDIILSL